MGAGAVFRDGEVGTERIDEGRGGDPESAGHRGRAGGSRPRDPVRDEPLLSLAESRRVQHAGERDSVREVEILACARRVEKRARNPLPVVAARKRSLPTLSRDRRERYA